MIKYSCIISWCACFFSSVQPNTRKIAFHSRYRLAQVSGKMDVPWIRQQKAFAVCPGSDWFWSSKPEFTFGHQNALDYVAAELSHYAEKVTRQNSYPSRIRRWNLKASQISCRFVQHHGIGPVYYCWNIGILVRVQTRERPWQNKTSRSSAQMMERRRRRFGLK